MDHEKDLHSQHVKNAVITPDPPDFGALGSILPFSISALPATPFSPYKTSPLGYSPAKVKKQIPVIQNFRAGNTSRSSPLNWENALSVVIIWNPERMAKAAK